MSEGHHVYEAMSQVLGDLSAGIKKAQTNKWV